MDFKPVTKDEFFAAIGKGNVHPRPETAVTLWLDQHSWALVGKSEPGWKNPDDPARYFLPVRPV